MQAPSDTSAVPPRSAVLLAVAVIACAVLALYANVGGYGYLLVDDDVYITSNPPVLQGLSPAGIQWAFSAPHAGNYHPLTWLSHMADISLFGVEAPGAHHWVNASLHAATSVVVFLALRALAGGFWVPLFATLLFALHPLRVESVAWLSERKDVLSGFFTVLALWAYAAFALRGGALRYAAVVVSLSLSLLSKSTAVTLPFVFLLLDVWPLRRFPALRIAGKDTASSATIARLLYEKIPLLLLSISIAAVVYAGQANVGFVASLTSISLPSRVANALASTVAYLGKFLVPQGLSAFYPHLAMSGEGVPSALIVQAVFAALLIAAISLGCARYFRRAPYLAVGWCWYLGMLVPMIGIVQVGQAAMADRYTYLPSLGLSIMVAWGGADLMQRWPRSRRPLQGLAVLSLVLLTATTWQTIGRWRNNLSLFEHAAAVTEANYFAHNQIGLSHEALGDPAQARIAFERAVELNPSYAWAHNNLASNHLRAGRHDLAELHFFDALRLNPSHVGARSNLAVMYLQQLRYEDAETELIRARSIQPDRLETHFNLALVYIGTERWQEAEASLQQVLRIHPGLATGYLRMGEVLMRRGDEAGAEPWLMRAIELSPADPAGYDLLLRSMMSRGLVQQAERVLAAAEANTNYSPVLGPVRDLMRRYREGQ